MNFSDLLPRRRLIARNAKVGELQSAQLNVYDAHNKLGGHYEPVGALFGEAGTFGVGTFGESALRQINGVDYDPWEPVNERKSRLLQRFRAQSGTPHTWMILRYGWYARVHH